MNYSSLQLIKLFLTFLLLPCLGFGHTFRDSLEKALVNHADDTVKVKMFDDLAWEYMYTDLNKSQKLADDGLKLSRKLNFNKGQRDLLSTMGSIAYLVGDFEKSLQYHNAALKLREAAKDLKGIAITCANIAIAYKEMGEYAKELKYHFQSAKILEELKDSVRLASVYDNIGASFKMQKNYTLSNDYHQRALKIREKKNDLIGISYSYVNLGSLNIEQKEYDTALKFFDEATRIAEQNQDKRILAKCYNNIGLIHKDKLGGDLKLALDNIIKSLKLKEELGEKASVATNYINLGAIYEKLKKYKEASTYFEKGIELAKETGQRQWVKQGYLGMASSAEYMGDYKTAYTAYYNYSQMRDTMINEDLNEQIAKMQARYESEKKEKDLLQARADANKKELVIQRRNFQILLGSVVFGLLAVTGLILFTRFQQKQKQKRELAVLETRQMERIRIAKDMHDDIGSGLTRIAMMSEAVKNELGNNRITTENEKLNKLTTEARSLVNNIGEIIWTMNPKNDAFSNMISYVRSYAYDYLENAGIDCSINFPEELPEYIISPDQRRNIFLVIKEILHNIVKHSTAKNVIIELSLTATTYSIMIQDDGKGFDKESVNDHGNGLKNMQQRIEESGGKFEIKTGRGTGTTVYLKNVPLKNTTKSV